MFSAKKKLNIVTAQVGVIPPGLKADKQLLKARQILQKNPAGLLNVERNAYKLCR